jgi:hypothetical protein
MENRFLLEIPVLGLPGHFISFMIKTQALPTSTWSRSLTAAFQLTKRPDCWPCIAWYADSHPAITW